MSFRDGESCLAHVEYQNDRKEYKDWNLCYVGGQQFLHDDRIGDFSVQSTNGSAGLSQPILKLQTVNNGQDWDVDAFAQDDQKLCGFCYDYRPTPQKQLGSDPDYVCGVPKSGGTGNGITSDVSKDPDTPKASGWCGVHVSHFKPHSPAIITDTMLSPLA